jgi:hypothetical protein
MHVTGTSERQLGWLDLSCVWLAGEGAPPFQQGLKIFPQKSQVAGEGAPPSHLHKYTVTPATLCTSPQAAGQRNSLAPSSLPEATPPPSPETCPTLYVNMGIKDSAPRPQRYTPPPRSWIPTPPPPTHTHSRHSPPQMYCDTCQCLHITTGSRSGQLHRPITVGTKSDLPDKSSSTGTPALLHNCQQQ